MKVVIDIPESLYRFYKTQIGSGKLNVEEDILGRLLNDSVVLPKGHGDLIDRSKLVFYRCKENVMDCPPNYDFACQNCEYGWTCRLNIDEAPIIVPADKGEKE